MNFVCEIWHFLAVCKLFMDRPQLMNTLKLLKYLLGTDFSPWGFLFVCFVWYSSYAPVGLSNAHGTE